MAYTVSFTASAAKDIRALDEDMRRRVGRAIDALADNPRPSGVEKLKGDDNVYRVRVGDYRILYQIADRQLIVLVIRVRHRREAYR
ncbi:MAG TPA: type II toxin-antitoxin system RelE/ParE family toxin [Gemmatimonadaceae bacterium]|jgi:mRNA interferase RelE/StbE